MLQSDIDTNESDADTAIALVQTNLDTHTTADLDLSATNELSDLNLDAGTNILTLTNPATGANEIDLSSYVSTDCLLYTSPSPRDRTRSRMPSSA